MKKIGKLIILSVIPILLAMTCNSVLGVEISGAGFSVSSNGRWLLFTGLKKGQSGLYRFDLTTHTEDRLTKDNQFEGWPGFLSQSEDFIFSRGSNDVSALNLFIFQSHKGIAKQLTFGFANDRFGSVSADGSQIAFARATKLRPYSLGGETWDDWDIYLINRDGTNLIQLTTNHFRQLDLPRFIGNQRLVFSATKVAPVQKLYTMDVRSPEQITELATATESVSAEPGVCANSSNIVFISNRQSRADVYDYELWTMGSEGGFLRQVSKLQSFLAWPVYDAECKVIYVLSDKKRNDHFELLSIDPDSGKIKERLIK